MKERPILFSAPMVRAILDGRKTQTRRVVKFPAWMQDTEGNQAAEIPKQFDGYVDMVPVTASTVASYVTCPYGQPMDREWQSGLPPFPGMYRVRNLLSESLGGDSRAVWVNPEFFTWRFSESDDPESIGLEGDITPENIQWKRAAGDRLWVRETYGFAEWYDDFKPSDVPQLDEQDPYGDDSRRNRVWYKADHEQWNTPYMGKWRPSIHMPRWASRINLEITGIRVERLNEISCADAIAEGIRPAANSNTIDCNTPDPRSEFRSLWESINGPESWSANPFVWVVEFKKLEVTL